MKAFLPDRPFRAAYNFYNAQNLAVADVAADGEPKVAPRTFAGVPTMPGWGGLTSIFVPNSIIEQIAEAVQTHLNTKVNAVTNVGLSSASILGLLFGLKPMTMTPTTFYSMVHETLAGLVDPNTGEIAPTDTTALLNQLRDRLQLESPIDIVRFRAVANEMADIAVLFPIVESAAFLQTLTNICGTLTNLLVSMPLQTGMLLPITGSLLRDYFIAAFDHSARTLFRTPGSPIMTPTVNPLPNVLADDMLTDQRLAASDVTEQVTSITTIDPCATAAPAVPTNLPIPPHYPVPNYPHDYPWDANHGWDAGHHGWNAAHHGWDAHVWGPQPPAWGPQTPAWGAYPGWGFHPPAPWDPDFARKMNYYAAPFHSRPGVGPYPGDAVYPSPPPSDGVHHGGDAFTTFDEKARWVWSLPDASIYFLQKLDSFRPLQMTPQRFLTAVHDVIGEVRTAFRDLKYCDPFTFVQRLARYLESETGEEWAGLSAESLGESVANALEGPFPDFAEILEHIHDVIEEKLL